ncbi:MAG: hypothetical protein HGB19_13845 [Chlorobiales bacterium]|nr:hypothetical protein [Chlorobiales bacterium]
MKKQVLLIMLAVLFATACSDNNSSNSETKTVSDALALVSPTDSSEVVLTAADNLVMKWHPATDLSGTLIYTVVLDKDRDFSESNGSVLRADVLNDTSLVVPYSAVSSLPAFQSTTVDTLYYAVYAKSSSATLRSKNVFRFTLKLQ